MEKLTKLEILNETVAYYNSDVNRRSLNSTRTKCLYNGENNTHCAVGRCMLPKFKEQGKNIKGNSTNLVELSRLNNLNFDEMLEEKYRGHEYAFWSDIQILHDDIEASFWDNAGITANGEIFTNKICEKYNLITKKDA